MIQATQTAQPSQPTPPAADPKPYVIDASAVPRTAEEVQALRIRIDDLKNELQNAAERRNNVAGRLSKADPSARAGYEARLQALDTRILQIENDITGAVVQLRSAPAAALIAGTAQDPDPNLIIDRVSNEIVPIVAIVSVFVFAPFALAIARFIWKRASPSPRPALADQATNQRLEQLQQAVDTIAVEVERISEGQRFVTKLLSERERQALGVGAAEPVHTAKKSASVPSERG